MSARRLLYIFPFLLVCMSFPSLLLAFDCMEYGWKEQIRNQSTWLSLRQSVFVSNFKANFQMSMNWNLQMCFMFTKNKSRIKWADEFVSTPSVLTFLISSPRTSPTKSRFANKQTWMIWKANILDCEAVRERSWTEEMDGCKRALKEYWKSHSIASFAFVVVSWKMMHFLSN